MRLARNILLATIGVVLSCVLLPSAALAATPPAIGSTWVAGVTQNDATLEAEVNPEDQGVGAYYQFQVVASASEFLPEIACPPERDWRPLDGCDGTLTPSALPIGFIEHGTASREARVDLVDAGMALQPDTTYHFRVLAARKVVTEDTLQWEGPAVVGPEQTFTTLATGPAPKVESESVSHITSTDATLETQINPEGRKTTYEFYLEAPSCLARGFGACEASGGVPIFEGTIPAGSVGRSVSVDIAGAWYGHNLLANTLYGYRVLARSASGSRSGREETFRTSPGLPPVIDSVSISHLTPTDATLEAQIDTEGLPTKYQFHLTSSPCSKHGSGCELIVPIPLPSGNLLGSFVGQTISLDLNSVGVRLGEGEYSYSVTATNEAGETYGRGQTFEAPAGVLDPPSPVVSPVPGGGQPTVSDNGDQSAGAATTPAATLQTSSPLGASTKADAPKRTAKHKQKTKHRHHRTKAARHRAQAKRHKR
jgi:hypothetical protein